VTDHRRTRTPTGPQAPDEPRALATGSIEELQALGATTDVVTAGKLLGISRNTAYRLARRGAFPLPLVRAGAQYRVPTAALIAALHPQPTEPAIAGCEEQ
jgi:excisionase family DNA binding protein